MKKINYTLNQKFDKNITDEEVCEFYGIPLEYAHTKKMNNLIVEKVYQENLKEMTEKEALKIKKDTLQSIELFYKENNL